MNATNSARQKARNRLFTFALALLVPSLGWGQIYKITDEKKGVVFTDKPPTIGDVPGQTVEELELQELNTARPPEALPPALNTPASARSQAPSEEPLEISVAISSPANESTIAMGPGDFSVTARSSPPLSRSERLVLMVDGQAYGAPQASTTWFVQGALRGPHDLVVRRTTSRGENLATSEPVRVYVLRPSIIRR